MTTCQECASEISEAEIFCPYCGIKIDRPAASAAPEPPAPIEDFDSTLLISSSEAAAMRDVAEEASVPGEPVVQTPPSPFSAPTTESNPTLPTLEDIPAPAILGGVARSTDPGFSSDPESIPTKETPVYSEQTAPEVDISPVQFTEPEPAVEEAVSVDEPAPAFETSAAAPEPEVETPAVPEPFASGSDQPAWAVEEPAQPSWARETHEPEWAADAADSVSSEEESAPVVASPEPEVPVFNVAAPESSSVNESFATDVTPRDADEAVEFPMVSAPTGEETARPDFAPQGSTESSEQHAYSEPEEFSQPPPVSSSIARPEDELEDPVHIPSMFDSVRIMEGEGLTSESANTRIADKPFEIPVVAPVVAEAAAEEGPSTEDEQKDPIRSTGSVDSDSGRSRKLKPLPEGTVLNSRYEIVRKIGGGGMGAVYLASDNNLGGVLRAVKEMVQAHIEEDQQEKAINDFKRESMILSTLDHPSIPTIYDYFYDAAEGRFYLVMKYISGGDLASKLRTSPDGKIDELAVTEWAIQLTDVLNYLHNQPTTIVYRDLKPSNIMLDGNSSRVMLIDFGIARSITQKEEKGVTAVGTMGYAPPELFSGNVEPRSDIYSLGSTLFHLLTGADPQSNPLLIFDFQKNPRPRQINSRLSDQMERILMRTVEYNADQRFSSAAELKAILEEHLMNLRSGNLTFGVTEAPISVSLANQTVFCGFCGQRIVATDLFCAFCGAKQPLAQKGVHSEIYHASAATARLVIEGTSELAAPIYALQKDDNLIGRRDPMSNIFPEVDLSKYDPQTKISRRHAKIWRDGTAFMLEDLGSSNGTMIEGASTNVFKLPPHQPYKLASGDRIKIGDTRLHFVVG